MNLFRRIHHASNAKKDVAQHLAVDLFVGLGWLLLAANRTAAAGYAPAKALLTEPPEQMRQYGALLTAVAVLCVIAVIFKRGGLYEASRIGLIVIWAFWATIFTFSFFQGDASPLAIAWSVAWVARTVRMPKRNPWLDGNQREYV